MLTTVKFSKPQNLAKRYFPFYDKHCRKMGVLWIIIMYFLYYFLKKYQNLWKNRFTLLLNFFGQIFLVKWPYKRKLPECYQCMRPNVTTFHWKICDFWTFFLRRSDFNEFFWSNWILRNNSIKKNRLTFRVE